MINAIRWALVRALLRLFENAPKTGPPCRANNALAKTLKDRGYQDPELWIPGMTHYQPKPSGEAFHTAATLLNRIGLVSPEAAGPTTQLALRLVW